MKLADIAFVSFVVLGVVTAGCTQQIDGESSNEEGALATKESQLLDDDAEAAESDEDLEMGLDEPLSGATELDPGSFAEGASDEDVFEKVRNNVGRFFEPAGCITSTREGNVVTHVFHGCRGPHDLAEFRGTITSTYVREPGKLTVTHETDGFAINGASITGKRVVVYARNGSLVTKSRNGSWSGTTAKGTPITHEANFVTTWDSSSRCITRDGVAHVSVGGRAFERTIEGYERCGVGRGGCPKSGELTLSRTKDGESLSLKVELLGGVRARVTRPNGTQVTRLLLCRPNAG
jgi:hypothetical protein